MVVGAHLVPRTLAGASHVPSPLRRLSLSDAFRLLHAPPFLLFLLAASLIQSSHALYLNWRAQGISDGMIGVRQSVSSPKSRCSLCLRGSSRFAARRGC